jgi:hypothetical protein
MKRRQFIGSAAFLLVPVPDGRSGQALAAAVAPGDYAFFDERFERARRIASSWPLMAKPQAVQGDITQWIQVLQHATRDRALQLRGVTTESFRFCLSILVREHAELRLQNSRLDENLFLWTMQTMPKLGVQRDT